MLYLVLTVLLVSCHLRSGWNLCWVCVWVWLMLRHFWIFGAFQTVVFLIRDVQPAYLPGMILKSLGFVCWDRISCSSSPGFLWTEQSWSWSSSVFYFCIVTMWSMLLWLLLPLNMYRTWLSRCFLFLWYVYVYFGKVSSLVWSGACCSPASASWVALPHLTS